MDATVETPHNETVRRGRIMALLQRIWPWPILGGVAVAAIGGITFWTGPSALIAPWDVFILLDGGYRITEGQVPDIDFFNPIGPVVYALVSLGMRTQATPSLAAVTYAVLFFLALAVMLAATAAHRRLRAPLAAAYVVFTALLVVSVRPLGYSPWTTSYAMLYNRFGWVLYTALLVLTMLRPRVTESSRSVSLDGAVLGLLLGLLFFCKANFFIAGIIAVGVGLALGSVPRRKLLGCWAAVTFLIVSLAMWALIGVSITTYINDVLVASAAQGGQRFTSLARAAAYNLPVTIIVIAVLGIMLAVARRRGQTTRQLWHVAAASGNVVLSSILVSGANSPERFDLPALAVVPLLLAAYYSGGPPRLRRPALIGAAALVAVTAIPIAGEDILSIGRAVALHPTELNPPISQRISSNHLRDFVIPPDANWQTAYRTASDVPAMIDDGIAMLSRHISPGDRVGTVALTDPFSFAMDLPPAGGVLWWDVGISFSAASHPSPDFAFGNTRWLMVPQVALGEGCCQDTVSAILDIYRPYLQQHFAEVQRSGNWILLGRTQ